MPDEPAKNPAPAAPELQRQRDEVRRSLLRANTAVALVLAVVFGLAIAAVWMGWRAARSRNEAESNQQRAEAAETKARSDLWRAYLSEARATRLGNNLERRAAALESIHRAAAIASAPELRNEAVAALALPEFKLESSFALDASIDRFAFDPALRRCALALTNGDVVIRALTDGRELQRLRKRDGEIPEEQANVGALEFSADGRRLSTRFVRGGIAIWDLESGRTVFRNGTDDLRSLSSAARFSSDGRFIVAPVFAPSNGMAVFEIESGREVAFYPEFSAFRHASVRPGAPMFAANNGTNLVVMNWETNERVEFPFVAGIRRTAWTPDGRGLVIAGNLLDVHVWDFSERQRHVFGGHKGDVWEVAIDPSSTRLVTSSEDGLSRIWDLHNERLLAVTDENVLLHWSESNRVGVLRPKKSLDVRRMATSPVCQSGDGISEIFDGYTMDISADGVWAVSIVSERGLLVWSLHTPGRADWLPIEGIRSICFHPTEPRLFITKHGGPESRPYAAMTNGTRVAFQLGEPTKLRAVAGRRLELLTISGNGKAFAWVELTAGRIWVEHLGNSNEPVLMRGGGHNTVVRQSSSTRGAGTISLSPDGQWLASGYSGRGAEICDTHTGEPVAHLTSQQGNVQFSPDGRMIVVVDRQFCRAFRTPDWSLAWQVPCAPFLTAVAGAAFSPDNATLAVVSSAHSAALVDVASGRELAELEAPGASPILTMRWTADGQHLVFSTRENHLDVWDVPALRRELSAFNLDWNSSSPGLAAIAPTVTLRAGKSSAAWIATGAFTTVVFVSVIAMLSLRRHRKLIEDFTRTEALAVQRERELEGEREIGRLKNNFVSMVSHEFRTPLGIIQSSAQILDRYLERLPAEQRREQMESITRNVRRMASLIDEVLVLGKVEAGQMHFAPELMDLAGFCRRLADEMLSATHQRCPIRLTFGPGKFSPALGDENLLHHILGNLISNAAKYSTPGEDMEFSVSRNNGSVVFAIRDRGIGIPVGDRDKLFTAFHRGSNASRFPGTGLGLTIVKRCVELHGGEIAFTSEEGKGTTFTVRIPMFANGGAKV